MYHYSMDGYTIRPARSRSIAPTYGYVDSRTYRGSSRHDADAPTRSRGRALSVAGSVFRKFIINGEITFPRKSGNSKGRSDYSRPDREVPRSLHRSHGRSDMRYDRTDDRYHTPRPSGGLTGYELVKRLKTGGMSEEVNLVKSKELGKLFIAKRVRADGYRNYRTTAELNVLLRIQRGQGLNYMVAHLWEPQQKYCTFILEYCDGGSLEDKMKAYMKSDREPPEEFVWHVLVSVADALAFLHYGIRDAARGPKPIADWNTTCHLDLKPCNIFLSTSGQVWKYPRVVLGDFGCAITKSDISFGMEHPRRQECGTPSWYPPEGLEDVVGRGNTRYGTETDIWQLGSTCSVMCRELRSPDRARLTTSSPCGSLYSKQLNKIVSAATNPNWKKRPTAAQLVKDVMKRGKKTGFLFPQ